MIFEVTPDQISQLVATRLVELMKRLLLAECGLAKIPLRASSVPLQITVPDGGEDGRVEWTGGANSTNYFPRRFCVFQSKAQALTKARVISEILKTKKRGQQKLVLNDAVLETISKKGAYVLFSSRPLTGQKKKALCSDAKAAIRKGGGNSAEIQIEIYDANRIADWVNAHPAVALWVSSGVRLRSVSGFQSFDGWSRAHEIKVVPWIEDNKARYVPTNLDTGKRSTG